MTDTEPPIYTLLAQPQEWNPSKLQWSADSPIRGTGSKKFLKTLHRDHYPYARARYVNGRGKKAIQRGRCVSKLAVQIWLNFDLRAQWLDYHSAITRLIPNI